MSFCVQGRPKGVTPKYSLKPLVPRLSELLGVEVSILLNDFWIFFFSVYTLIAGHSL